MIRLLITLLHAFQFTQARKTIVAAGIPREAEYFPYQLVNHNDNTRGQYWKQRFYTFGDHFQGPGHPIFVILGGEGPLTPETGILYPFIAENLAASFGAFVLQPEHRFYGESQPILSTTGKFYANHYSNISNIGSTMNNTEHNEHDDPRVELLTPIQALQDAIRLIHHYTHTQLNCSHDRFSSQYCPIVAVGGSYPGFLAQLARAVYPHVFDMAYAASSPSNIYAQTVVQDDAYYNHITRQTDVAFPGCAAAVKTTLTSVVDAYVQQQKNTATFDPLLLGVCDGTMPDYITNVETFLDETIMMVGYTFANANMGYYPPSSKTALGEACDAFMQPNTTAINRLKQFLVFSLKTTGSAADCFNMSKQLPSGTKATISSGDWSGVGAGGAGESWDFQTCTLCVERIAFGNASMFPARQWTSQWLEHHCKERFGVTPRPREMADMYGFDRLVEVGASRILFTNGLVDGWSVGGVQANLSDTLIAINFQHGAHHSDLSYYKGQDDDATDDIKRGRAHIRTILAEWLADLPGGATANSSRTVDK